MLDDFKKTPPQKKDIKNYMGSLIHHFKYYSDPIQVRQNEVYVSVEAPKVKFGIFLISDNTSKPYRCIIKAPGFNKNGIFTSKTATLLRPNVVRYFTHGLKRKLSGGG